MYNVYVRWVRDGSWALVFVCVLGGFPMSVCAVLSTMRTRQILFLSCTPWPLTLVENFDKKSSTWGSWPHVEHRRPGGRRGGLEGPGRHVERRGPEMFSTTACPRISTTPPHLPKDCSSSWDDLQHRLPQSLHCQRRHSTLSRPSPPCSATMFRNHLPQSCGNSAVGTCRGPVQLWVWPRQKLSQGGSYLQSTLWRMINLLLNMQTDHLAITGKSTPLKNTALENARFPPRAIHWYWIIHHFKVPTYLHAHETVYRINPYHNIPQQSHECMFYTNTQTCTNTWHCVS